MPTRIKAAWLSVALFSALAAMMLLVGCDEDTAQPYPACTGHGGVKQIVAEGGNRAYYSTYFLCKDGTVFVK